jgi:hypothetical protein
MMKVATPALAALLVVGGMSATTALSAQDVQAPASDLDGARALIDRVFTPYTHDDVPDLDAVYTPQLKRSIARQSDGDLGLGYDPLCSCQDTGEFSYRIAALTPIAKGATARIERSNFGESSTVTLTLARRGGQWLIADIDDGSGSLLNGQ